MIRDEKNKTDLERKYLIFQAGNNQVMFDENDIDWTFSKHDIQGYKRLWKSGISYPEILQNFNRPIIEMSLLHLYLAHNGEIEARERGLD